MAGTRSEGDWPGYQKIEVKGCALKEANNHDKVVEFFDDQHAKFVSDNSKHRSNIRKELRQLRDLCDKNLSTLIPPLLK